MTTSFAILAILALQLVLFVCLTQSAGTCDSPDAKVLIFGAGMSGVSAAKKLYDDKWTDFIILEARDRVGGRMRSQSFAGVTVEVGANWIHGVDDTQSSKFKTNPVWDLRQKAGLMTVLDEGALKVYGTGRTNATSQVKSSLANLENYYDKVMALKKPGGSSDISVRAALTSVGWNPAAMSDQFADWFWFDTYNSIGPDKVSLYGWDAESTFEDFGDSNYLVVDQRGYEYLVQYLGQSFISTAVRFNTVVTQITYKDNCVCATARENGVSKTYCGNYGIVTFSIGVLQSNAITFSPTLPQWKTDAIRKFVFPLFLKVFIQFNETFWDTDVNYIGRLNGNDPGNYTLFVPVGSLLPSKPSVLLCILVGDEAKRVALQDVNTTEQELYSALQTMYQFRAVIVDILVPDWASNSLYYGSYSSPGVGVSEDTYEQLGTPVDSLYFSGEATSELYIGSVHGAYLAGVATATSITGDETATSITGDACQNAISLVPAILALMSAFIM